MYLNKLNSTLETLSDLIADIAAPKPEHVVLSNKQIQQIMGVSRKTAQKWRDQGLINYSKIGREIFYRKSDILDMLDKHLVPSYSH